MLGRVDGRVVDRAFLDELHHLTWIAPKSDDTIDAGWNCRMQALLFGAVSLALGHTGSIHYGKASFVHRSAHASHATALSILAHAWVFLDGHGISDLSMRFTDTPGLSSWLLQGVFANRCFPDGALQVVKSEMQYHTAVNVALADRSRKWAIYCPQRFTRIEPAVYREAFGFAPSPLTDTLVAKNHNQSIVAKAAVHLFKFLKGQSASLRHLPQQDAWSRIAEEPGDPVAWLMSRGERARRDIRIRA